MQETTVICDMCGKEIPQKEVEDNVLQGPYSLHLYRFGEDEKFDMYKDLCEDCAEKVHEKLQELDWNN